MQSEEEVYWNVPTSWLMVTFMSWQLFAAAIKAAWSEVGAFCDEGAEPEVQPTNSIRRNTAESIAAANQSLMEFFPVMITLTAPRYLMNQELMQHSQQLY